MERVAAARLGNRIGGGSRITRCAAAGRELLWIAEFVLDQHVRRFQQNKMRSGGGRRQQSNCDNGEACGIFHLRALPVVFKCLTLATLSHQKLQRMLHAQTTFGPPTLTSIKRAPHASSAGEGNLVARQSRRGLARTLRPSPQ